MKKKKEYKYTHALTFTKTIWEKLNELADDDCTSVSSLIAKWTKQKHREKIARNNRLGAINNKDQQ